MMEDYRKYLHQNGKPTLFLIVKLPKRFLYNLDKNIKWNVFCKEMLYCR